MLQKGQKVFSAQQVMNSLVLLSASWFYLVPPALQAALCLKQLFSLVCAAVVCSAVNVSTSGVSLSELSFTFAEQEKEKPAAVKKGTETVQFISL